MSSADSAQNAARWTPDHNCIQYAIGQSRDLPPKATSPDDDVSASGALNWESHSTLHSRTDRPHFMSIIQTGAGAACPKRRGSDGKLREQPASRRSSVGRAADS